MVRRRPLPAICIDENLSTGVADNFREAGYRVVEVSKHPGMRGRDERSFLSALSRDNSVFVTGDTEFVNELVDSRRRHAGVVYIPQPLDADEKELLAYLAAHFIMGRCAESPRAFRERILYVATDGFRMVHGGKDRLHLSFARLRNLSESEPTDRARRKLKRGKRSR